jgi:hypothetical protein
MNGARSRIRAALNRPGRTEGVRKIAERFGVNPGTVQKISRPFEGAFPPHEKIGRAMLGSARPSAGRPLGGPDGQVPARWFSARALAGRGALSLHRSIYRYSSYFSAK